MYCWLCAWNDLVEKGELIKIPSCPLRQHQAADAKLQEQQKLGSCEGVCVCVFRQTLKPRSKYFLWYQLEFRGSLNFR